jgi:hypothetical protein
MQRVNRNDSRLTQAVIDERIEDFVKALKYEILFDIKNLK